MVLTRGVGCGALGPPPKFFGSSPCYYADGGFLALLIALNLNNLMSKRLQCVVRILMDAVEEIREREKKPQIA